MCRLLCQLMMICHRIKLSTYVKNKELELKDFVYSFNSIMNALAMGTTTQGNVAHSMFKETI